MSCRRPGRGEDSGSSVQKGDRKETDIMDILEFERGFAAI